MISNIIFLWFFGRFWSVAINITFKLQYFLYLQFYYQSTLSSYTMYGEKFDITVTANMVALKQLSAVHSVRLLWVPGHSGSEGNEVLDMLATRATCLDFVGPESAVSVYLLQLYALM